MSDNNNVRVYVRVRPLNDTEKMGGPQQCIKPDTEHHSIDMNTKPEPRRFTYDHVAGIDSTQEDVFQKVGRTITDTCLAGYNGTIFAYGQTGSGKTFTIQGKDGSNRGLMPRVFNYLCGQIAREERKQGSKVTFQCSSSFLEIYNDRIYDLLDSKPIQSRVALNIREDKKKGVFVDNLTEEVVKTADEMLSVMQRGIDNRRVGSTAMNMESSRSHSVFSIAIRSTEMRDGLTVEKYSRFNLIDLAGSERQKATNATGDRLKEASRINKSLSALGMSNFLYLCTHHWLCVCGYR